MDRYYFGYGRNTNLEAMKLRCPAARPMGLAMLENHRFRFARHADVVHESKNTTYGVLWRITPECLKSLDKREGYPYIYNRKRVFVEHADKLYPAWTYYMDNLWPDEQPDDIYWKDLCEGYRKFGVPLSQIYAARSMAPERSYTKQGYRYYKNLHGFDKNNVFC